MFFRTLVPALFAAAASSAIAAPQWVSHDMSFSLQQANFASGLRPHPNVIQFLGNALVDVVEAPSESGVVTNPLYKDKGVKGDNPLCGDTDHLRSPDQQFEIPDIISITLDFGSPTWELRSPGIVHRDLACRNVLLATRFGDYASAGDVAFSFMSDAQLDAFAGEGKPPVRWTAPESIRLYRNGDSSSTDWVDIEAGAVVSTVVIPSPAGIAPFFALSVYATRRRRM